MVDAHESLHLGSLTIGPMGQTHLVHDNGSDLHQGDSTFHLTPQAMLQSLFRDIGVRPAVLRIDTYPVFSSPNLFSRHLTVLEVIAGNNHALSIDFGKWNQILSQTPNLVELHLWHAQEDIHSNMHPNVHLLNKMPALKRLELTGLFMMLSSFFAETQHPKLD
jgi:hypothetical protein